MTRFFSTIIACVVLSATPLLAQTNDDDPWTLDGDPPPIADVVQIGDGHFVARGTV